MLKVVSLYFISQLASSLNLNTIKCSSGSLIINGESNTTYIATAGCNKLEIKCDANCKADSSTNMRLEVYSIAKITNIICAEKDSCYGALIGLGVPPAGVNLTAFVQPFDRVAKIECKKESSCKEIDVPVIGNNIDVTILAEDKASLEEGSIACGTTANTGVNCLLSCGDAEDPCKEVSCLPEANCGCVSLSTTLTTCPTPKPTLSPSPKPTPKPTNNPSVGPTVTPPTGLPTVTPPTTKQPSSNPVREPTSPPEPVYIDPCESVTPEPTSCTFTPLPQKIYVCSNKYNSCTATCPVASSCTDMTLISSSLDTTVDCNGDCSGAKIILGSSPDLSLINNLLTLADFEGIKNSATINCGTLESSCKDISVKAVGSFRNDIIISGKARTGLQSSNINCDINDDEGRCILNCIDGEDICKDIIFDCLAKSTQCICNNKIGSITCPKINQLGTPSCPPNSNNCIVIGEPRSRIIVTKDTNKVEIICNDCIGTEIYSAAKTTIINGNSLSALQETIIKIGDYSNNPPLGIAGSEFNVGANDVLAVTLNLLEKASGKDIDLQAIGKVDITINALNEQAFENSIVKLDTKGSKVTLNCIEYWESCEGAAIVCPYKDEISPITKQICGCNDIENTFNSTEVKQSSCPTPTLTLPILRKKGAGAGGNGIRSSNIVINTSKDNIIVSKKSFFGIIAAIIFMFIGCSIFIWCNYKNKFFTNKYYSINSPPQKAIKPITITSHSVEMEATH